MIVRQYQELIDGLKTHTRRCDPPTWAVVGKSTLVVPKRGLPAWWYGFYRNDPFRPCIISNPAEYASMAHADNYDTTRAKRWLAGMGFVPVSITVLRVWWEPLQAISEADAKAEGVESVDAYRELWQTINMKPGKRWQDNPRVCCVEFERTEAFAEMVVKVNYARKMLVA